MIGFWWPLTLTSELKEIDGIVQYLYSPKAQFNLLLFWNIFGKIQDVKVGKIPSPCSQRPANCRVGLTKYYQSDEAVSFFWRGVPPCETFCHWIVITIGISGALSGDDVSVSSWRHSDEITFAKEDDDVDDDDENDAVFVQSLDFAAFTVHFTKRAASYEHLILSAQLIHRFTAAESPVGAVRHLDFTASQTNNYQPYFVRRARRSLWWR